MKKKSTTYLDYQQRATEFEVGDNVTPYHADTIHAGRVVAVYPAIGMVDVQFPHGATRYPVEDLQVLNPDFWINPSHQDSVPGGAGTVSVPGGPHTQPHPDKNRDTEADAELWTRAEDKAKQSLEDEKKANPKSRPSSKKASAKKIALYWQNRDRKYRATRGESDCGTYQCPKCKDVALKKCIYKREEGISERLMGCPSCLFLIKRTDIMGHPDNLE